jgi:hypothetical protein
VLAEVAALAAELQQDAGPELSAIGLALTEAGAVASQAVAWLLTAGARDPRLPAAASVPLLLLLGTVLGGHQMARAAQIAARQLRAGSAEPDFFTAKLATAHHYAQHVLPEALALGRSVVQGADTVMALPSHLL